MASQLLLHTLKLNAFHYLYYILHLFVPFLTFQYNIKLRQQSSLAPQLLTQQYSSASAFSVRNSSAYIFFPPRNCIIYKYMYIYTSIQICITMAIQHIYNTRRSVSLTAIQCFSRSCHLSLGNNSYSLTHSGAACWFIKRNFYNYSAAEFKVSYLQWSIFDIEITALASLKDLRTSAVAPCCQTTNGREFESERLRRSSVINVLYNYICSLPSTHTLTELIQTLSASHDKQPLC